jgi:hypothetical protein
MRLSAPKQITWVIALILGILGVLGSLTDIQFVSEYNFWFLFAGWLLLILATLLRGL